MEFLWQPRAVVKAKTKLLESPLHRTPKLYDFLCFKEKIKKIPTGYDTN